jgi:hypothetical protein
MYTAATAGGDSTIFVCRFFSLRYLFLFSLAAFTPFLWDIVAQCFFIYTFGPLGCI